MLAVHETRTCTHNVTYSSGLTSGVSECCFSLIRLHADDDYEEHYTVLKVQVGTDARPWAVHHIRPVLRQPWLLLAVRVLWAGA